MTSRFRRSRLVPVAAVLGALVAGSLAAVPVAAAPEPEPSNFGGIPDSVARTDRVVVSWSGALGGAEARSAERIARLSAAAGRAVRFERLLEPGLAVYELDARLGASARAILGRLAAVSGVARVEPDLWVTADAIPNDPYAASQWGMLGSTDGSAWGTDVLNAWPTTTGSGVVVAVVDTGITVHPDLAGQTVAGYDFIADTFVSNDGNGRDADPSDPGDWTTGQCGEASASSWHGTHVTGTVVAIANNATGVFGGAPAAKVQPVRVLGRCGGYLTDVGDGIRWASGGTVSGVPANATPARVINVSLGGGSSSCPSYFSSAISAARSNGAVVVVAAGNSAANAANYSPANCSAATTVAAITSTGVRASFSNYGAVVDVAAPGAGIWSTVNSGTTVPASATYANWNGTSMATPHAAAAVALLLSAYPTLTPEAAEAILRLTSKPLSSPPVPIGAGAVNAGSAVTALAGAPFVSKPVLGAASPSGVVTVTATAIDPNGVASAEMSVGGGAYGAMSSTDGAFGETIEAVTKTATLTALQATPQVCIRASDGAATSTPVCTTYTDSTAPSVASFGATTASPTALTSISYGLTFSEPISGLAAGDFQVGGTSTPWSVTSVTGSGSAYTIVVSSPLPTLGTIVLTLKAGSIADGSANTGPGSAVQAPAVIFEPFMDIAASMFRSDIIWIYLEGITSGCGTRLYCPNANVTRAEMASFLARALSLPPTATDYFADDAASPHQDNINRLAAAGVTTGCAAGLFCPGANVTRGEMASFLARALALQATQTDFFTDDETSLHEDNINRLAAAGVTTGCTATTFCPNAFVTRGQMAAFLRRAFD